MDAPLKQTDEIYCPECAKPIKKDFTICPYCRTEIKNLNISPPIKADYNIGNAFMEPEKIKEPDFNPTPGSEQMPENEIIEKKGLSRKEKNIVIGAVVLLIIQGISIGLGISRSVDNIKIYNRLIDVLKPATTQSTIVKVNSTPNTQTTTSTIETQLKTTNPETNNSSSLEVYKQTISVEAMDAMTIEEFAKVSYANRAAYAYMKNPELNVADTKDTFDPTIIPDSYWQPIRKAALNAKDANEGAKIYSTTTFYTTNEQTGEISNEYQATVDSIISAGGVESIGDRYIYVDNGVTQTGKDRDGNNIEYTNITFQPTRIKTGEPSQPEYTAQTIQVTIKLDDGRIIVTYPMICATEGKRSPIEGKPY